VLPPFSDKKKYQGQEEGNEDPRRELWATSESFDLQAWGGAAGGKKSAKRQHQREKKHLLAEESMAAINWKKKEKR